MPFMTDEISDREKAHNFAIFKAAQTLYCVLAQQGPTLKMLFIRRGRRMSAI